ncbi:MAG: carbohydrate-binding family 9-like protein [bacterium]
MKIRLFFPLLLLCHCSLVLAQPLYKSYLCYRTDKPIMVDGNLDESGWKKVPWSDPFMDIEGSRKPPPRLLTCMKMLWDKNYLYIGAALQEPNVWATLTQRDTVIFNDNDFEVFIDPNGDSHDYGEFEMNAFNTGWDLFLPIPYKDGGKADDGWNINGLKTGVKIFGTLNNAADQDSGWTVEIAIPWKALSKLRHTVQPPLHGNQWRVNFSRVEWKTMTIGQSYQKIPKTPEDNWVWSPQGVVDMHRPEEWGIVQFSTDPIGKSVAKPYPYLEERKILHKIYYAQKSYYEKNKSYADSLEALDMRSDGAFPPILRKTSTGFQAMLKVKSNNGRAKLLIIREDAKIWIQ